MTMMNKPDAAISCSELTAVMPSELSDQMLVMVSGGNSGIGQAMGSMLNSAGGMPGMMASAGKTPGADMGSMLATAGGMKNAMALGDMG